MPYVVLIALSLFFASCDQSENSVADNGDPIAYEIVNHPYSLRVESGGTLVFRDWNTWYEFWGAHPECGSDRCVNPAPYVDFENETVAAIFWGTEPQGCHDYAARLNAVFRFENQTTLDVAPVTDSCALRVISYPALFVRFARADGPVNFIGSVPGR
jgi:hypothetical protein